MLPTTQLHRDNHTVSDGWPCYEMRHACQSCGGLRRKCAALCYDCKVSWIDQLKIICKMLATAMGCWGEDSNLTRLKVSANRFEAGPNPASRFLRDEFCWLFINLIIFSEMIG
jgi:hypothetical protein